MSVYVTVRCPSVCLSRQCQQAAATCSWFAAVRAPIDRYRPPASQHSNQQAVSCWEPRHEAQHRLVIDELVGLPWEGARSFARVCCNRMRCCRSFVQRWWVPESVPTSSPASVTKLSGRLSHYQAASHARSVQMRPTATWSVCLLVTTASYAEMAELIEMPLGMWTRVKLGNHTGFGPPVEGAISGAYPSPF